jgi:PhzF family phenazine biosynthesis protein
MRTHPFKQVDAFTSRPLFGNPVAVVFEADGMSDEEMQRVAAWTNLSETTFLQRPTTAEADYRLRIFHPTGELPFAGHPTIGSAHAALEAGLIDGGIFVQECGAGLLPLRAEGSGAERRIYVQAPAAELVHDYSTSIDAISQAVGAPVMSHPPPVSVRNGPVWLFCRLESSAEVRRLSPDLTAMTRLSEDFSLTGFATFALVDADQHAVHIRCFAPAVGVPEDPVTGSANAALPTVLALAGLLNVTGREYVSTQGTEIGRDGRVHVRVLDDNGCAEIGGQAVTVIDGQITL